MSKNKARHGPKHDAPIDASPALPHLSQELVEQLKSGALVKDSDFDRLFPLFYRQRSSVHWSSIKVARQVAEWLNGMPPVKFMDIGCGVGKLCILLRILTTQSIFGIEQREACVVVANRIAEANDLRNFSIQHMNMLDLNWADYDVWYLYNPFQEHLYSGKLGFVEDDIEFEQKYYVQYTDAVLEQLNEASPGKILMTFHGYGGSVPRGWRLTASKHIDNGKLSMWIKEGKDESL